MFVRPTYRAWCRSEIGGGIGRTMTGKNESTLLGKLVFTLTAIAMLYFFWWLLIYDHGIVSIHH